MPVHPLIQRAISLSYQRDHAQLPCKTVAQVRQYYRQSLRVSEPSGFFEDISITPSVTCRLHRPNNSPSILPVLFYLRASAYVLGGIDDSHLICQYLAAFCNCVVVALEPRLAPEHKFPDAFTDCLSTIDYCQRMANRLKISSTIVTLWGESSGGNLAAALAHDIHLKNPGFFKQQILFYPMLNYHDRQAYASSKAFSRGYLMDAALSDWFMQQYLAHPEQKQDHRVSPLLAQAYQHLPPTLIISAQYDPFRDEAYDYSHKLSEAGVSHTTLCMPGLIHGFLSFAPKIEAARFALDYAAKFLRGRLTELQSMNHLNQ